MSDPTPSGTLHQLSIPLPFSIASRIHLHLTIHPSHLLLFLTSTTPETTPPATLGSFVYALPSNQKDGVPLSTPLYVRQDTLETATRIAKILVKKTGRPVYVGSSMGFASAGRGGDVGEEMEGVRRVVETVVGLVEGRVTVGKAEGEGEVEKRVEGAET